MKYILDPDVTQEELNDFLDSLPWIPRHLHVEELSQECYCASCIHFRRIKVDAP